MPFTKFRVNIYRMLGHRREACPDKEICYLGLFNSVVVEMNAFKINRSIWGGQLGGKLGGFMAKIQHCLCKSTCMPYH